MSIIPWRSRRKINAIESLNRAEASEISDLPRYIHKKQCVYNMHLIYGPYTWMCDYFFFKPDGSVVNDIDKKLVVVLAFVHCNSRFFDAHIVRDKSGMTFKTFLERLILSPNEATEASSISSINRPIVDTLITDSDKSFGMDVIRTDSGEYKRVFNPNAADSRSIDVTRTYELRKIQHISYNARRDPLTAHSKMSIINRMARTLRDMIFNAHKHNQSFRLNEDTLHELCKMYNTSPHSTLSQVMGFDVTPQDAYMYRELQDEIYRRLKRLNYVVAKRIELDDIRPNDIVYVYQPREPMKKRRNTVRDDKYRVLSRFGSTSYVLQNVNQPHSPPEIISRSNIVLS